MPAYSFQKQFVPLVESGQKRQTIRAVGKRRHARQGELLQIYTGMRTKSCCKLLNTDPVCISVQKVRIEKFSARGKSDRDYFPMYLDGKILFLHEVAEIATADGFNSVQEFFTFFDQTHGMPFNGLLIKW